MDQQGSSLVPSPHEGQQIFDMGFARKRIARGFHDDIGNGDDEMFFGGDRGRPRDRRSLVDQRDQASRPVVRTVSGTLESGQTWMRGDTFSLA
jgi:hypothetical protein